MKRDASDKCYVGALARTKEKHRHLAKENCKAAKTPRKLRA
jgi:hypothetical protein